MKKVEVEPPAAEPVALKSKKVQAIRMSESYNATYCDTILE